MEWTEDLMNDGIREIHTIKDSKGKSVCSIEFINKGKDLDFDTKNDISIKIAKHLKKLIGEEGLVL